MLGNVSRTRCLGGLFILPLVVFVLALSLKSVHPVHVICLVVTTVDKEVVGTEPFVCVKKEGNLARPRTSVDKVAVEQIPMLLAWCAV